MYRPGEGRIARFGALGVILAMAAFGAYRWYLFGADRVTVWIPFLFEGRLPIIGRHALNWGELGAALIFLVATLVAYRISFVRPGSSDFLVETEIELRKVTWPEWKPLFRAKTEIWGSAYIVILVTAALTLVLFAIDSMLTFATDWLFFRQGGL